MVTGVFSAMVESATIYNDRNPGETAKRQKDSFSDIFLHLANQIFAHA
jgi:hypothetical protein